MNLGLIDRLSREPEPFYAPVPDAGQVFVNVIQGGVPYRFQVERPRPGWWLLRPRGTKAIIDGRTAPAREIAGYLSALNRQTMIALFPSGDQSWEAVHYTSVGVKRVHLVRHQIKCGSHIWARSVGFGDTLIYDSLKYLQPDYIPPEATSIIEGYKRRVEEDERKKRLANQNRELSLDEQLALAGAQLISVRDGTVEWAHDGHTYSMQVSRTGQVEVAGVCLDGTDRHHNLVSIVGVMQRHRELGRTY